MMKEVVADVGISVLRAILSTIDTILVHGQRLVRREESSNHHTALERLSSKPKVVIVGASFAGLAVQQKLSKDEFDVTIVDYKEYFEYTPGVLRCLVEPNHFASLSCSLQTALEKNNGTRVVTGEVVKVVDSNSCILLKDGRTITYDHLVLATGSSYASPVRPSSQEPGTLTTRQQQWNASAQELERAQTCLIVGAGAVGVELAAEILQRYRTTKRVVLVDLSETILPGFHPKTIQYAQQWLEHHGAELHLGSPLKEMSDRHVVFTNGTKLNVDVLYKCSGSKPNSSFFGRANGGPRGSIVVNDNLQVEGYSNIFCAGDLCHHEPTKDALKLGHTAELQGHLLARNIELLHKKQRLVSYPQDAVGRAATPALYVLSLGTHDASLRFNSLVINGVLAAIFKWLIEWTKVAAMEQRPVGLLFWIIGDNVSNWLGRTLIPTPIPTTTAVAKSKSS